MPENLRPLGFVERLFEEGNRRYAGWLMVRAVLLSGECDIDRLREAADHATASIPLFATTIVKQGIRCFFSLPETPLPTILESVERTSPEQWKDEVEQQLMRGFEPGALQWRLVVIASPGGTDWELLLVYNHALADPVAASEHLKRILEAYQNPSSEFATCPFPKPVEQLLHQESGLKNTWRFFKAERRDAKLRKKMIRFKRPDRLVAPVEQRHTRVRFARIPAEESASIIQKSKQREISFQGLLLALAIRAGNSFETDDGSHYLTISNISLRSVCGPDDDSKTPGCFVYWFTNQIARRDTDNLQDLAAVCTNKVRETIPIARPPISRLGKYVGRSLEKMTTGAHFGRHSFVGVSNIGKVDLPASVGDLELREDYTITGQQAIGSEVTLLVSTFQGALHLTFCFVSPLLTSTQMDEYRENFLTELNSFGNSE